MLDDEHIAAVAIGPLGWTLSPSSSSSSSSSQNASSSQSQQNFEQLLVNDILELGQAVPLQASQPVEEKPKQSGYMASFAGLSL